MSTDDLLRDALTQAVVNQSGVQRPLLTGFVIGVSYVDGDGEDDGGRWSVLWDHSASAMLSLGLIRLLAVDGDQRLIDSIIADQDESG